MSAEPLPERNEFDREIVALMDELGIERAARPYLAAGLPPSMSGLT